MRWMGAVVVCAVLGGGAYAGWRYWPREDKAAEAPVAVPVTVAPAREADLPVYLTGIGAVRALNSVDVHSQVMGVLLGVPVREGQLVRKGEALAVIDPRPFQAALDKAVAQRQQDQAQLENGQADLKRYSSLAQRDFASRQQLDTQTSTVARFTGVVAADDAAIEQAKIELGYCVLRSPLDGRIGLRRVDPGNLVQANGSGAGLLTVVQETPMGVVFTLPAPELPRLKAAMARGAVKVIADRSDRSAVLAEGVLLAPDNEVDASSGTFSAKATFGNADGALTPGQFVSVRVQVGVARGVVVPHEAVQHGQGGLFVFTVQPDETTKRRDVQVVYDDGSEAVLSGGVAAGASVVVAGQSRIGERTKVASRKADVTEAAK